MRITVTVTPKELEALRYAVGNINSLADDERWTDDWRLVRAMKSVEETLRQAENSCRRP